MRFALRTTLLVRTLGPVCITLALLLIPRTVRAGDTFAKIRATGVIRCRVSEGLAGSALYALGLFYMVGR